MIKWQACKVLSQWCMDPNRRNRYRCRVAN